MADIKRLHYFTHQFLVESDFTDEQQYHLAMRRRHNAALHDYGVADGLAVTRSGDREITIQPGMAIDRDGRELVLLDSRIVSLSDAAAFPAGATVHLTIAWHEEESDPSTATGVTGKTRITERPLVLASTTAPAGDGSVIRLARLTLTAGGNVPGNLGDVFADGRQLAGAALAPASVATDKLADGAVDESKLSAGVRGKLVTSGDGHDHSGGDGAQIRHSSLSLDGGSNPHGTTAADVGALSSTGGTIVGNLELHGGNVGLGTTPEPLSRLSLSSNAGSADFTRALFASAQNPGTGQTIACDAYAYGEGTGTKHGVVSEVRGAGDKYAGLFDASSPASSPGFTNALHARAGSDGTGEVRALWVNAEGSGTGLKQGIECWAEGTGEKRAAFFAAKSLAGSADSTGAVLVSAINEGSGETTGLQLSAEGPGPGQKTGMVCNVHGSGNKFGGIFRASSNSGTADIAQALRAEASSDGTGDATGFWIETDGAGPGRKNGLVSNVNGSGSKYGGQFYADSRDSDAADITEGLIAAATSEGTGNTIALNAFARGNGTAEKCAISALAQGGGPKWAGKFFAQSSAESPDTTQGLYVSANSQGNGDVYGLNIDAKGNGTGNKYGIYSYVSGEGTKWAGYFIGDVYVSGMLSKASGTFLIDHPLDPENKTLRHSFVESPEDLCLYRGKVPLDAAGKGSVKMPAYFAALTREEDATVSLTAIGSKPFLTGYEWNRNFSAFTVYGEPGREVSYLVLADRDDPVIHQLRRPVEEKKGAGYFQKGELLNPEAYGKAPKAAPDGVGAARQTTAPMDMAPPSFADFPAPPTPTAPPDFPLSPAPTAPFPALEEEHRRIEEAWAKSREEQRQRMESFQHEEQQRRRQLEEALAAPRQQPDQTPQERGGPIETIDDAPETPSAPPEDAPPRRKRTVADRKKK